MPDHSDRSFAPRAIAAWIGVAAALFSALAFPTARGADAPRKTFDLPAEVAESSLRKFSEQSGTEVVFATSTAGRVRTNEVKGSFTPREALDRMVAGTGLIVEQDARTGALMVARDPNGQRAAQTTVSDRPIQNPHQPVAPEMPANDVIVNLSPFEVDASNQRGYYAANTMAGTRLNSKIEDLASSITVVTKEQMADFAMLDINDIFKYEASTEGTANYTDITVNASGVPVDNTMVDPNNANRIRGIGSANISEGNFETSGRVPIDPIAIDGVEISRGPNSSIFGLGNPSGTVNTVPASANLFRDKAQVQVRGDSFEGYRASLDVNRVLKRGVLAARGSAVFQHDGYRLKPSGTDSVRLNGMVKLQPFKSTSLTASYAHYRLEGNRPNTTMPRDAITAWIAAGSPTWDPLTSTRFINGQPVQVGGTLATTSGLATLRQGSGRGESHLFIDRGEIGLWTPGWANNSPAPGAGNPTFYYVQSRRATIRDVQPLFSTDPVLSNKEFYDWTSLNLAAMNSQTERTATTKVQLEHIFFDTPLHTLAVQGGWYREDSRNKNRYFYGKPTTNAVTNYLHVDPNTRLLNGQPNPYFLRPYLSLPESQEDDLPLLRDTYRAQLAYKLDLTTRKNWLGWLGRHNVSGYGEDRDYSSWSYLFRDAILSTHSWAPAGDPRGSNDAPPIYQNYYHFYVGDNQGNNVDYAPSDFRYGIYDYTWGNPPNQIVERAELGVSPVLSSGTKKIQKTEGAVLQSFLLRDRLVTTFGLRNDKNYNRSLNTATWAFNEGRTTTAGAVLKPLSWLALHANKSDSFIPSTLAQDLNGRIVPDPTGKGEDYGFSLNLFRGKLNIRVNQYETRQLNSRNGTSTTLAGTIVKLDIDDGAAARGFGLDFRAPIWIRNSFLKRGITPTQSQIDARLTEIMQMDPERRMMLERLNPGGANGFSQIPIAEPSGLTAKGKEIEVNYNPSDYWTLKLNLTEQETIDGRLAPNIEAYLTDRMAVWQNVIDEDTGRPWFTTVYGTGGSSASGYLTSIVLPRIPVAKATENKSRPQVRKYRVNLSQNFRLAGITDHRFLKRFSVGGAARWEDRGAIGYYGVEQLPAIITALDPNRPVWDKAHLYIDLFTSYRTRIWSDKVGMTLQLNVRNVQENGRLQPVSAYPDGTPNALRIIDPRQFILTATFDL
jgi:hypothetical protein